MESKLTIKAGIQVQRPPHEVFEAIADPGKMSHYFISRSTGRMEPGRELTWHFPEFEQGSQVRIGHIDTDRYISFYWGADPANLQLVEITLFDKGENGTHVTVTEKEMDNNEAGIKWLKSNTEGWANFLACLKAYLEYGINLRKGAFDYMKQ